MREIKFRGKRVDDNEWSYGYYWHYADKEIHMIQNLEFQTSGWSSEVDGDTVGQYTGLRDCNEKEIYEGDIISEKYDGMIDIGQVVFNEGAFMVDFGNQEELLIGCDSEKTEVIGNIYDNPELIK